MACQARCSDARPTSRASPGRPPSRAASRVARRCRLVRRAAGRRRHGSRHWTQQGQELASRRLPEYLDDPWRSGLVFIHEPTLRTSAATRTARREPVPRFDSGTGSPTAPMAAPGSSRNLDGARVGGRSLRVRAGARVSHVQESPNEPGHEDEHDGGHSDPTPHPALRACLSPAAPTKDCGHPYSLHSRSHTSLSGSRSPASSSRYSRIVTPMSHAARHALEAFAIAVALHHPGVGGQRGHGQQRNE
jgi:hypothetical protein